MATELTTREVRLDTDGEPWTGGTDPVLKERIRELYRKLCDCGESGRQLVAVYQELIATLDALIEDQKVRRA